MILIIYDWMEIPPHEALGAGLWRSQKVLLRSEHVAATSQEDTFVCIYIDLLPQSALMFYVALFYEFHFH